MAQVNLNVQLWPVTGGYIWSVPTRDSSIMLSSAADIGTAVRNAHAAALREYGSQLGAVDFHLVPGL